MSIYKPNLWLNQWYRGEKCTFLHTWKIWIATKGWKIKGGQNQRLEAPKQTLLHHESALFLLKNVVFWGSFKTPHNQLREILWHHFWRGAWIIFYQLMKSDKTRLTNYQHYPSLDGQSQLRTMAYGWTHDVDGWLLRLHVSSSLFLLMMIWINIRWKMFSHTKSTENKRVLVCV